MIKEIVNIIKSHESFTITSHLNPDGDSLGSQLALGLALRELGKEVRLINRHPVPKIYQRLPGGSLIEVKDKIQPLPEVTFFIECSYLERTGFPGFSGPLIINIDHHKIEGGFGDVSWVEPSASSVGEMLYQLIEKLGVPLSYEIAYNLYAAIFTDTGSFQFANTSPRTFEVCSHLVKAGAQPVKVAEDILYHNSFEKLRILGKVLSRLEVDAEGRIAWIYLLKREIDEAGLSPDEGEGFVNFPLSLENVEVVIFFKELEPSLFRVSLRSRDKVDVSEIARYFKGGGHRRAAGCYLEGDLTEVVSRIISWVKGSLKG
jgi:phosphoesterase RecJ-like protein